MRRFGFNLLLTLPNVDQGRALGGRTSCRRVRARDGVRVSADDSTEEIHAWDHGCQFFRADTAEFRECILPEWLEKELAVVWDGRFGVLEGESSTREPPADFFGLPGHTPVFIGVGGMHSIATGLLQSAASLKQGVTVEVKVGARVATIVKCAEGSNSGKWQLLGTTGEAALHDSKEEVAAKAEHTPCSPLFFDALLVTDASASFEGWHRASAGLPECAEQVMARVRQRVRVPLFTAIVAFESTLPNLDLDGISFNDDRLWFAARSSSKSGLARGARGGSECWTLVSTPAYAVAEITRVPMQDPVTGAFCPQDAAYLQSRDGPARTLLRSFAAALAPITGGPDALPAVSYITAQRWGSAMPAPPNIDGRDASGAGPCTKTVRRPLVASCCALPPRI
jgi:predicted NAD/FAD-dependent oxidoreductase